MLRYNINKITNNIIKNPKDIIEVIDDKETKSVILPAIYLPLIKNILEQNKNEFDDLMKIGIESMDEYLVDFDKSRNRKNDFKTI